MTLALKGLALAVVAYALVLVFMYAMQRNIMYLPNREPAVLAGLSGVEAVSLRTPDGETLVAWYLPPPDGQPIILFLHGNAGSIAGRINRLEFYRRAGFGALFLSYRGYGGSTGSPSEAGLIVDATTAYDWLASKGYGPAKVVLVGESLGSGVAVQLATSRKVAAVALEAPYTSMIDVANTRYWFLPVRLLLKDVFDSRSQIRGIGAPLLISHDEDDAVVPYAMGRELFDAAVEPKQFYALKGYGHGAIFESSVWLTELAFFRKYAAGVPQ